MMKNKVSEKGKTEYGYCVFQHNLNSPLFSVGKILDNWDSVCYPSTIIYQVQESDGCIIEVEHVTDTSDKRVHKNMIYSIESSLFNAKTIAIAMNHAASLAEKLQRKKVKVWINGDETYYHCNGRYLPSGMGIKIYYSDIEQQYVVIVESGGKKVKILNDFDYTYTHDLILDNGNLLKIICQRFNIDINKLEWIPF